jgi:hypothetical protein
VSELYCVSVLAVAIAVVLVDRLVVPSAGCKIVVGLAMIMITRKVEVFGKPLLLIIQCCCIALQGSCHHLLPVNIGVPTPVFAKTSFHLSNSGTSY